MEATRIIIVIIVLALILGILVSGILSLKERKTDKLLCVVKTPILLMYIGVCICFLSVIVMIYTLFVEFTPISLSIAICALIIFVLGSVMALYTLNWRLVLKKDTYEHRSIFRINKKFFYSQIVQTKRIRIGLYVIHNNSREMEISDVKSFLNDLQAIVTSIMGY